MKIDSIFDETGPRVINTYLICHDRIAAYREFVTSDNINTTFVVNSLAELKAVSRGIFLYLPDIQNNPEKDHIVKEIREIVKHNPEYCEVHFYKDIPL